MSKQVLNISQSTPAGRLAVGQIPLNLTTVRIIATNAIQNLTEAGLPDGNTAGPALARVNGATDPALRLQWAATEVNEVQFAPVPYPPDLDDAATVTLCIMAAMAGATDTPTIAAKYFEGKGDTNAGGNTAAITGTGIAKYTVAIAASDVGAYPNFANIALTPAAHGTDALYVYAAWLEYTRKA